MTCQHDAAPPPREVRVTIDNTAEDTHEWLVRVHRESDLRAEVARLTAERDAAVQEGGEMLILSGVQLLIAHHEEARGAKRWATLLTVLSVALAIVGAAKLWL